MLRPITTSSASANPAPVAVNAGAATTPTSQEANASAIGAVEAPQIQAGAAADPTFRYNSFEFVYRQDIGRIVLVGQSPETGERVIQVPSEQALRAYERTARAERHMDRIQSKRASAAEAAAQGAALQPVHLAKAMVAAVSGANHGSGVVSISA